MGNRLIVSDPHGFSGKNYEWVFALNLLESDKLHMVQFMARKGKVKAYRCSYFTKAKQWVN